MPDDHGQNYNEAATLLYKKMYVAQYIDHVTDSVKCINIF